MLRELRSTVATVTVVMLALGIALGVGYAAHNRGAHGDVVVGLTEYHITMPTTLAAGRHTFVVTDHGGDAHELIVFRTDAKANALPVAHGKIDEASPLLHAVASSGSSLKPGETRAVRGTLTPGHYVAVCNLPLHYGLGMRVDITVTGS